MRTARPVRGVEDLLRVLDALFDDDADRWTSRGAGWWDGFYADRKRDVPFFREEPDESLVAWCREGLLPATGRALDIGCGPGRNAVWLATQGFEVDAVDLSDEALAWGKERADHAGVAVRFARGNVFEHPFTGRYDLVYDSGLFHHLPPHRRISYGALLEDVLAPGGAFGLACFATGAMGTEAADVDLYRTGSLGGGVAYGEADLREIFDWLDVVRLRRMHQMPAGSGLFGESVLWAGLFRRAVRR